MTTTHDDIIDVNITLAAAPVSQAGFGRVLFLATDLDLGSDAYRVYTSASDITADSDLSSAQALALTTALSQSPQPDAVLVAPHDAGGGATYSDSIDLAIAGGAEFYGLTIESRVAADIISVSDEVEALGDILFVAQSAETEIEDGSDIYAGVFSGLAGNTRTVLVYHDDDTQFLDVGYAASRLVFDPDVQSAGWQGRVAGVDPYASFTGTQEDNAEANNVNLLLPFGPYPNYVSSGVTIEDRAIEEIVSADWFKARLEERLIQLKADYDARGEKIPLSPTGQNIVRGELEAQLAQGVDAGHFVSGFTVSFPDPIADSDIQARTLRASASAQFATNAAQFVMNINLTRV